MFLGDSGRALRTRSGLTGKKGKAKKVNEDPEAKREYERNKKRKQREKEREEGLKKRGPKVKVDIKHMTQEEKKEYERRRKKEYRMAKKLKEGEDHGEERDKIEQREENEKTDMNEEIDETDSHEELVEMLDDTDEEDDDCDLTINYSNPTRATSAKAMYPEPHTSESQLQQKIHNG